MTYSADLFREIFRRWASGVAVVSSMDGDHPHAMVVSSFASLAPDPPTVMFSASASARLHRIVAERGSFAVSVLSGEQAELFDRFTGFDRTYYDHRFLDLDYAVAETGNPVLPDAISWLDCKVVAIHPGEGYTIFVGEIVAASLGEASEEAPMIYFRRERSTLPYEGDRNADVEQLRQNNRELTRVPAKREIEVEPVELARRA